MLRIAALAFAAALTLSACESVGEMAGPPPTAADYAAVLADPKRPEADRTRDAARKPAELLALAGVRRGDTVADWVMGGGYFTRLLAAAVGPTGKVYGYQPAEFVAYQATYGTDQDAVAAAYANVTPVRAPINALRFAEPLDAIVTVQNYHDLYLKNFPVDTASKGRSELFRALKPGGVLLVVDHAAQDGSNTRDSDSLHRIDRQTVIDELTAQGFVLESGPDPLRNAADPRTQNVFDPAIRGKTDQFTLKFRKPA